MQIISGTTDFQIPAPTAVAVGKFDGIHKGHQKLIKEIIAQKKHGLSTCCFTFEPSPGIFFGSAEKGELTTGEEKRRLFAAYQEIDYLVEFPLTKETAAMDPMKFVTKILVEKLRTRFLAVGADFTFGKGGAGNVSLLREVAAKERFQVSVIEKECYRDQEISSTWVRAAVLRGDMELAARLLGMPYSILGTIEEGQQLGRTIGFPTINCRPDSGKLLPPRGVYFTEAVAAEGDDTIIIPALSNIGTKPTVSDHNILVVETHLCLSPNDQRTIDAIPFSKEITLRLLHYHRPEYKLGGLEALKTQIADDVKAREKWQRFHNSPINR
jgi:riboflavin kinase/FMN adenylyltransferase